MIKKVIGILTAVSVIISFLPGANNSVAGDEPAAHTIEAGASHEANPLKGMVPFDFSTTTFPHSLEWFYIPVSDVQKSLDDYDWSLLENRLNQIAGRGHQAVFRFYYDYPGEGNGVPQFLINQGLEMKYYNEPIDLGGSGYCPDYENAAFRQSMVRFIHEFGAKYDGDGRIGYITLGLLGFWGEWHNWPYDEDTSDGKPDWSISTEVYREVLDAFDESFNITQLCVREPKGGINYANYDIGFHDDSFGYATLSVKSGGQDWSFMQKMFNFNLGDKWKTNCIGGEVYPPSQNQIFSGAAAGDSFQDWNLCMDEAHATWMLNESIKSYRGAALENAKKAALQLGYDFQVTTAYYNDIDVSQPLELKIDIKDIGSAPFYYDHKVWPVQIGIKDGNTLIREWTTDWDLCDIQADGRINTFYYRIDAPKLEAGDYTICIRVKNPIENGNILGFANQGQESDGWLSLGTVNVRGVQESETETTTREETGTTHTDGEELSVEADSSYVYCDVVAKMDYETWQIYIDADHNNNTGFIVSKDDRGYEYMIENGLLYRHNGNDDSWSWSEISSGVEVTDRENGLFVKINREKVADVVSDALFKFVYVNASWEQIGESGIVPLKEKKEGIVISDKLEINGFQMSAAAQGFRTVYSVNASDSEIVEKGLVYGLADYASEDEMYVGSSSPVVYQYAATEQGKLSSNYSDDEDFQSYAMTMRLIKTKEFYLAPICVRAYVRLKDGSYEYSKCENMTVYGVSDYLYRNHMMPNTYGHDYLYNDILKIVQPDYQRVE